MKDEHVIHAMKDMIERFDRWPAIHGVEIADWYRDEWRPAMQEVIDRLTKDDQQVSSKTSGWSK